MLNKTTIAKLKRVGFSVKKVQETFLAVCRDAIDELGGPDWQKRELPSLFKQLEKEIVGPLCIDADGPQLSRDTFKKYLSAAKKSLLFGVPFRMGWMVTYKDLPRVKSIVEQDERHVTAEIKVRDAIKQMRAEKHKLYETQQVGFLRLPLPSLNDGESWVADLLDTIADALKSPEAQILMRDNRELKQLAKLVAKNESAVA